MEQQPLPHRQRNRPKAVSPNKLQLLGVAFASADLTFEVTQAGDIAFVVGAAQQILGLDAEQAAGRPWRDFLDVDDTRVLGQILADIRPGERRSGIRLRLLARGGNDAETAGELSVFRQPFAEAGVSCAFRRRLTTGGPRVGDGALLDRAAFETVSRRLMQDAAAAGEPLHLDLLEAIGLEARPGEATPIAADAQRRFNEALRATAYGGFAAARLAADRFALMRSGHARLPVDRLAEIAGVRVETATTALSADVEPGLNLRAIRFALDRHIEAGPEAAAAGFQTALDTTLRRAQAFRDSIARNAVDLVFQPIVHLTTRQLHHFEALARFGDGTHPEDTIRLAEELDMITEFDAAVFSSVAGALHANPTTQIAVNLSGRSLMQAGVVERLIAFTAGQPEVRKRLVIEITETHALKALDAANTMIGRLQAAGHTVCLDDFGAGAASLDYLRHLHVDVVKIDGRYIRTLLEAPRERVIVQHVVNMCRDLGIAVIAEMIETEETARVVMRMGAALGQGWLFGQASPSLTWGMDAASA